MVDNRAHAGDARVKDWLNTWGLALLLVAGGFLLAYHFVEPAPPRVLRVAAGDPGGAYHRHALAYRERLARDGITLEVITTAGAVENLRLAAGAEPEVDLAFVQGGLEPAQGARPVALGSLYYEPLWVFHRLDPPPSRLSELTGRRIAVGAPGSGTRAVTLALLEANGISEGQASLLGLDASAAAGALLSGEIDAAFLVGAPELPAVTRLAGSDAVALLDLRRSAAYGRLFPYLAELTLPEGALDLAANRPPAALRMVGVTAVLAARKDLHPALIDRVLQVATEVHGGPGLFRSADQFPSPEHVGLPLSERAERFYRYGPPLLQRYLPFWAATLVDRLKVMLLPLVGLLFPLVRLTPPVYRWRVRSRVYRIYRELQRIDPDRAPAPPGHAEADARLQALQRLEDEVNHVQVPPAYADELYHLRMHLALVRERLAALKAEGD